jgi:hypothetical protein
MLAHVKAVAEIPFMDHEWDAPQMIEVMIKANSKMRAMACNHGFRAHEHLRLRAFDIHLDEIGAKAGQDFVQGNALYRDSRLW